MKTSLAFGLLAIVSAAATLAAGAQRTVDSAAGDGSSHAAIAPVADVAVAGLGLAPGQVAITCDAKTIGFWTNPHGQALIRNGQLLAYLPSFHVVDANGDPFATDDYDTFEDWMKHATAVNMAYMLSAQLTAMEFNVLSGMVHVRCITTSDPLGEISVGRLMDQAIMSLRNDGYTPVGDPNRARQEVLKDALDAANNNLIWL